MSPKPVDFDRALAILRAERPTSEATDRARAAIAGKTSPLPLPKGRGFRKSLARPLAFAMMTTALALALVFPPHTPAGSAWAQTLVAMRHTPLSHSVNRDANGHVDLEEWRGPNRRATVLYGRKGEVICEMRTDGKRSLNYFNWADVARFQKTRPSPNAESYAIVSNGAHLGFMDDPIGSVETITQDPRVKVVGHEEAKDGKPETYRLRQTFAYPTIKNAKPYIQELIAEIEPETRRIRALSQVGGKGRKEIDYPETIPASVFEPRVQRAKVDETFDLDAQAKAIQRTLRGGIAKDGPVTLRAVLLDASGALWSFWTGAMPDGRLSRPVRYVAVPSGPAYGMKAYTSDWKKAPAINGRPTDPAGPRLGGMARVPEVEIGATVDVDVPYEGGVAHFRKVPIRRIGMIRHLDTVLGVRRDYR